MKLGDVTKYKTSKAPYVHIRIGDIVERYEGAAKETVVFKDGDVQLKNETGDIYPMLKVDRVYATLTDAPIKRKEKK